MVDGVDKKEEVRGSNLPDFFFFGFSLHLFSAHSLKLTSLNAFLFTALSFVLSLCIVLYLYNRIHWAATMPSPGISSTGTKRRT